MGQDNGFGYKLARIYTKTPYQKLYLTFIRNWGHVVCI